MTDMKKKKIYATDILFFNFVKKNNFGMSSLNYILSV